MPTICIYAVYCIKCYCIIRLSQPGGNLDLSWQNDRVQHKGFIPLEWLKQHHYPDQEPVKKAKHESKMPEITKVCSQQINFLSVKCNV